MSHSLTKDRYTSEEDGFYIMLPYIWETWELEDWMKKREIPFIIKENG